MKLNMVVKSLCNRLTKKWYDSRICLPNHNKQICNSSKKKIVTTQFASSQLYLIVFFLGRVLGLFCCLSTYFDHYFVNHGIQLFQDYINKTLKHNMRERILKKIRIQLVFRLCTILLLYYVCYRELSIFLFVVQSFLFLDCLLT